MGDFVQAAILVLSAAVAYLLASKRGRVRRWGYVIGLASEPFWLYASWVTGQWAVVLLAFWWAFNYARGITNNWSVE